MRAAGWYTGPRRIARANGPDLLIVAPTADGCDALSTLGWPEWSAAVGRELRAQFTGGACELEPVAEQTLSALPADPGGHLLLESDDRCARTLRSVRSDDRLRILVYVSALLPWFQGHFPGHPVLPGVVLLDWAVRWIREGFGECRTVRSLRRVKFQRIVQPRSVLSFSAHRTADAVEFVVTSGDEPHARATVTFEPAQR